MNIDLLTKGWMNAIENGDIEWYSVEDARDCLTSYFKPSPFFKKDIKAAVNAIITKAQELDVI